MSLVYPSVGQDSGAGAGAGVALIQTQAVEQGVGDHRAAGGMQLAEAIVDPAVLHPALGLAAAPVEGIVDIDDRDAAAQCGEPIPHIPGVGIDPVVGQIAVEIVGLGRSRPVGQAVVGIVGGGSQCRRQVDAGSGAAHAGAPPGCVVAVGQRLQGGARTLVGQRGELIGIVVAVVDGHQIGERGQGAPAGGIVGEAHGVAALGDAGEAIGVVVPIGDRRLTHHLHLGATTSGVVLVVHGGGASAQGRDFLGQGVEAAIVLPRDAAGYRIGDLGQAIGGIPGVGDRAGIGGRVGDGGAETRGLQAIQGIVGEARHLALAVGEPRETARAPDRLKAKAADARDVASPRRHPQEAALAPCEAALPLHLSKSGSATVSARSALRPDTTVSGERRASGASGQEVVVQPRRPGFVMFCTAVSSPFRC